MGDADREPRCSDAEDVVSPEDDAADTTVDSASDSEDGGPEDEVAAAVEPAVVEAPAPVAVHDAYERFCRSHVDGPRDRAVGATRAHKHAFKVQHNIRRRC